MAKRRVVDEPLVHFVVLGAMTAGLWAWLAPPPVEERVQELDARVRAGEGAGALARLEEELLVQEGRRLGVDRDDPIVRRRIAQRMRYLYEEIGEREPTEAELETIAARNPERHTVPARRTFDHHYFAADEDTPRPTTAPTHEGPMTRAQVEARWGAEFAKTLFECPLDTWCETSSVLGAHEVRPIEALAERPLAGLIRNVEIHATWIQEQRDAQYHREMVALRERYGLEGELP